MIQTDGADMQGPAGPASGKHTINIVNTKGSSKIPTKGGGPHGLGTTTLASYNFNSKAVSLPRNMSQKLKVKPVDGGSESHSQDS
jgi:hypothetical protein